jgi:hypothetical protein
MTHRLSATVLALGLFWALPAFADGDASGPAAEVAASSEAVVVSAETIATPSNSDALALATKSRRKPTRIARTPPARLAALSHQDWHCTGIWCGRQFVLMIGIGF